MLGDMQCSFEVAVVGNGSTDATPQIGRELAIEDRRVRFEQLSKAGRGGAIKMGRQSSEARILIYMDIDLSTVLSCFPQL